MSEPERRNIASVEDADDNGDTIEGTATYAAPDPPDPEPTKEKSNTSKARKEKEKLQAASVSASPTQTASTDSDLTAHASPERKFAEAKIRRDKEAERPELKRDMPMRPGPKKPAASDQARASRRDGRDRDRDVDPFYYGVQPGMVTPATSRPRAHTHATRPNSYYGPSANAHFYGHAAPVFIPHPHPHPHPHAHAHAHAAAMHHPLPTSYPPQAWATAPMPQAWAPARPPATRPIIQQERMARPLEARFGTAPARPQSAIGHRGMSQIEYGAYDVPEVHEARTRQSSTSRQKVKGPRDGSMGPPPRPASTRPVSSQNYRPPCTPLPRRVVGFQDDHPDGHMDLFQDISPMAPATYAKPTSSRSGSVSTRPSLYDRGDYRTEVAGHRHRTDVAGRRQSYFQAGSDYEDKIKQAEAYQEDVDGTSFPLTAESLRNAGPRPDRARSRSMASREESDYRPSATTRTTRSGGESEDYTITVKGPTTLKVGGAEMVCQDGAEISISKPSYRAGAGSDESSYADQDDRKTRYERMGIGPAPSRRATSQAGSGSLSRGLGLGLYSGPGTVPVPVPVPVPGHEHANPFVPPVYDGRACMHGAFAPPYPPYPGSRDGFI